MVPLIVVYSMTLNTFNGSTSSNYNENLIDSYYKSGVLPNNRYSWQGGIF
jgi:hypothetical protein